jgi:hypothetical protein
MRRRSDFPLVLFLLFALSLQVLWLFTHSGVLHWPWQKKHSSLEKEQAGIVLEITKNLKRREAESLLWEVAEINQPLFFHDSILTLSQSEAVLKLDESTEIRLAENTLVTLEPQDEVSTNQIRLKFFRGNLSARSSLASTTRIEGPNFSLDLQKDSEIQLRQTDSQQFEVEVIKGDAEIQRGKDTQSLSQNQVLQVDAASAAALPPKVEISDSMKFSENIPERIYTHTDSVKVGLQWQAEASQVKVLSSEGETQSISVSGQQNSEIKLGLGSYNLRLENEGVISKTYAVEVLKAPEIHLLAPAPRLRVKTQTELEFVWTEIPQAASYRLEIVNKKSGNLYKISAKTNAVDAKLVEAGEFEWRVVGIDRMGFEIPHLYTQTLFASGLLLAAPKLKDPRVRFQQLDRQPAGNDKAPAKKEGKAPARKVEKKKTLREKPGAWLWNLFVLQAYAQEVIIDNEPQKPADYEAVFEWEKVPGADRYVIEISETPDFLAINATKKVRNTRYIWSGFKPGTYYWRVAGATSDGEVGEFSVAARFTATELPVTDVMKDGVIIRKKVEAKIERAAIETKTEAIEAEAPKPLFQEKRFEAPVELNWDKREISSSYVLTVGAGSTSWNLTGASDVKAKFSGTQPAFLHFQTEQKWSDEKSYLVDLNYSNIKWSVSNAQTYPYQQDLRFTDYAAKVLFGSNHDRWSYGLSIENNPLVKRVGLEEIEINSVSSIGPSFNVNRAVDAHRFVHSGSLGAGNGMFSVSTFHEYRYVFFESGLSLGLRFDARMIFNDRNTSSAWGAGLILGFEK